MRRAPTTSSSGCGPTRPASTGSSWSPRRSARPLNSAAMAALPTMAAGAGACDGDQLGRCEVGPQRHAVLDERGLQLTYAEVPVEARRVQDRADDRGLGAAVREAGGDVVHFAGAARRDHGHVDGVGDGPGDLEVVAGRGAVTVDAVDDDLARAQLLSATDPLERVEAGRFASAVDEHLVSRRDAGARPHELHLRAEHDALAAERVRALADDLGSADGHRVDADLLGACLEHLEHVVDRSDSSAHRERDEHVAGDAAHGVEVDLSLLGAGGEVVGEGLVELGPREAGGEVFGGGDVDVVLELLRLRDPAVDHVEARDEALRQHRPSQAANSVRSRRPRPPLFSAWNCVATTLSCGTTDANSMPYSVRPSASAGAAGAA